MSIGQAAGGGFAPTVLVKPIERQPLTEQEKYQKMWERGEYREVAPGERDALTFLAQAKPERDAECIDFGCGTGRGALMLALFGSMKVTMIDFADNCLDPEVREALTTQPDRLKFLHADLTETVPINAAYGYCTDVMEHLPTEVVPKVIKNILASAQHVFFTIALFDDTHGALIGETLHLTVKPPGWWIEKLTEAGAVIHWSRYDINYLSVYCTIWRDANDVVKIGRINTEETTVDAQVRENILAGWQHITPYDTQKRELIVLAGGPSMAAQIDEIKKLRAEGCGLVTANGAYGWALAQGLEPSVQVVLDAREFNQRFTRPVTPYTKYLIASQVHPSTLEGLPRERTFLWHSGLSPANEALVREKTGFFFPVPGGSTVILRSFALLRMMGFKSLHLFGFDSCVADNNAHHAYAQPENDNEPLVPVVCGGKSFQCTPWMLSQASEFRDMVKFMGDEIECAVYGDGLIAQMIRHGAEFSIKQEA